MPPSPADAFVAAIAREQIGALAQLYARFTHALDPYSPERDQAELVFHQQIAERYDQLPPPKPHFHAESPNWFGREKTQKAQNESDLGLTTRPRRSAERVTSETVLR